MATQYEPIWNNEFELQLLQALMMREDRDSIIALCETMLNPADFYRPANRLIYEMILKLAAEGTEIHDQTLWDTIQARKDRKGVDQEYIASVHGVGFWGPEPEYLCKVIRDNALLRTAADAGLRIYQAANTPGANPEEVCNTILALSSKLTARETTLLRHISEINHEYLDTLSKRMEPTAAKRIPTGIRRWDHCAGWLGERQLILLKARRGSGKTHWAIHLSQRVLEGGRAVAFFSLEMSAHQLVNRFHGRVSGVDSRQIRYPDADGWIVVTDACAAQDAKPLYICDRSGITVQQMAAGCHALRAKGEDVGLVCVDYAELIGSTGKWATREQELTNIAAGLRNLSADTDCAVLLLSQVNKEGGERGSEGLGNAADLLFNWSCGPKDAQGVLTAEKNRHGEAFDAQVKIDKATSHFEDVTP